MPWVNLEDLERELAEHEERAGELRKKIEAIKAAHNSTSWKEKPE